jgi:hypothetical protein
VGQKLELTPEQFVRVQDAIKEGRFLEAEAPVYRAIMQEEHTKGLRRLASAWSKMSEDQQDLIRFGLAQRASVDDPWLLDLGVVAAEYLNSFKGVRGSAVRVPGLRAAARELWQIWKEAGKPSKLGKLNPFAYGDKPKSAYPACDFVARSLLRLFPDHFSKIRDPEQQIWAATVAADSQLRELVSREREASGARQKTSR